MAKKQRKRNREREYVIPPHIEEHRQRSARMRGWKPHPPLPQRRVVLGGFGLFLICAGFSLALWLPAHFLAQDLRSQGVTAAARVIGVDDNPAHVKVRFVQGPKSGTEVDLWDYAGMYPDVNVGDPMLVTYDPKDPQRSLARNWVSNPPANLPAYGTSALALLALGLTVIVIVRRRKILRMREAPTPEAVSLTKS
ncbi:hypothetical protein BN159_3873 [Streptomyces davaonensis JCM 4913]|uniref:DUF3592 domain-containing protein n=1 Tax=Streptomyces davaonensis (strain DSM 101723 / JCM 4913 / KCC S-0913 / 768) TaxID=1214101 RepID=K4R544_STRDJ|nr:DUF3592 domain-containing protein [Streptomyces davaonensis]CCK28252.1 hypothetical protein BN159_3873 [Streptomyces davaonensis JCM 4913]